MNASQILTRTGPILLGHLLGKGAEGAVYEVAERPDIAAKIYLKDFGPERTDKLVAMQALLTPKLASLTAWPSELLHTSDGRLVGFLMPIMRGSKDIHTLYGPRSRLAEFPRADWRMLVRAAANTARAFAVLHESGCLVGDVNHGGIRVAPDATVKLIDCDSFQVRSNTKTFLCEVGVENFTPAELQGVSFRNTPRTEDHDNFGLAVLIFHLLMMGRHPFAGRYRGPEEMPIPKAIGQFRYAYGRNKTATGMEPPPNTPPVAIAGEQILEMWEQAFGRRSNQLTRRPSAQQWVQALTRIETSFVQCNQHSGHYYLRGTPLCPWCPIERIGVALFPLGIGTIAPMPGGAFDLDAIWAQIKIVQSPRAPSPLPTVVATTPSSQAKEIRVKRGRWQAIGVIAGLVAFAFGMTIAHQLWFVWAIVAILARAWTASVGRPPDTRAFTDRQHAAKRTYDELAQRWSHEATGATFEERLSQLQRLREEWIRLPALRQKRYADLVANRELDARLRFLGGFEIEKAVISGIGPAKKSMLESYGIESAAEITYHAVLQVPGFGPALTKKLTDWRAKFEQRFVFDPNTSIDPRHLADMDHSIQQRKAAIEREMRGGAVSLQQLASTVLARRQALADALRQAATELANANADLAAVS